ncbi:MAG: ferredoxin, partial [Dongiaceae bacterium]
KIYNDNLPEADRVPACVATCPTSARHFGDLADPNSEVSQLVSARGGYDLMPEMGYRPTNKYLPPRPRRPESHPAQVAQPPTNTHNLHPFLRWVDNLLSR